MGDYGIFESIEGSDSEKKVATRETQRKLDAAIDDVKAKYGPFLFASRDVEEFNDRVALCKNDMMKTIDANLMPVTGVVRRVVKACKDDWKRLAWDQKMVDQWADNHGGSSKEGHGGKHRLNGEPNEISIKEIQFRRADKTGPELKPKGDWEAYLNSVDENSDAAVDNCFKEAGMGVQFYPGSMDDYFSHVHDENNRDRELELALLQERADREGWEADRHARKYYADNGIGAAPQTTNQVGTGEPANDPIAQAPNVPQGIPGIQAARYLEATGEKKEEEDNPWAGSSTSIRDFNKEVGNNFVNGWDKYKHPGRDKATPTKATTTPSSSSTEKGLVGPAAGATTPSSSTTEKGLVGPAAASAAPSSTEKGFIGPAASGDEKGGAPGAASANLSGTWNSDGSYTVGHGDTLSGIAQSKGMNYQDLVDSKDSGGKLVNDPKSVGSSGTNIQQNADLIHPGDVVRGFGGGTAPPAATPTPVAAETPKPSAAPFIGGGANGANGLPSRAGSLALDQYMDWCDSFGYRRASINNLDIYAANLNDRAYFEIASAITDPSSPIYREAASDTPLGTKATKPDTNVHRWQGDEYLGTVPDEANWNPQHKSIGMGGPGKSTKNKSAGGSGVNKGANHLRTAAPDYLQKADEALTNLLNQKAEEFQETIAPLQQALQTVQQAEQAQAAMNPMGVQPPAGTVNVLPGGGDPSGGGGGGDPMAAAQALSGMGGDPSMGGGGMDPSMMMQARRRRQEPPKKVRGANSPRTADVAGSFNKWMKNRGPGAVQGPTDAQDFAEEQGYGQKGQNYLQNHVGPDALLDSAKPKKNPMRQVRGKRREASFFTRKVAGWSFDDHLNGYVANKPTPFTCKCGSKLPVPSYSQCKCGKLWNSYVIGTGGENRQAAVDKYICREVPVRDGVIVASTHRRRATMNPLTLADSAPHPDKPAILVYGGAFNPPHSGHSDALQNAHNALANSGYSVEGSVVVPTADKLLANKLGLRDRLPLQDRASLISALFPKDINGAPVSVRTEPSEEVERSPNKPRRSDLARWVQSQYPNHTVINVTGEDASVPGDPGVYPSLYSGEIGSNHEGINYLTMPRDADNSMSSSKIRAAEASGQPVPGLTPEVEQIWRELLAKHRANVDGGGIVAGKVKRHNLSDPGPLGDGKDDKMPDINEDLGKEWYRHGPGGKWVAKKNRRR